MASSEFNINAQNLDNLLKQAVPIAQSAGDILERHYEAYKQNADNIDIEIKEDKSPVTNADKDASKYIVAALQQLTPDIPVISEENTEDGSNSDLYWAVDPLDGTKEFLGKTGGFFVKIALIHKEEPILGVVYCPVFETTYYTRRDAPSIKTSPEGTKTLHTKPALKKGELTTLFNQAHADPALYENQRQKLEKTGINLPETPDIKASLPRDLQVAEGIADIHLCAGRDSTLQGGGGFIWDTAADFLILKNAGGALLGLNDGMPLRYSCGRERMPSFIATGDKKLGKKLFP